MSLVVTLAGTQFLLTDTPDSNGVGRIVTKLDGWYDTPKLRTAYTPLPFAAGSVYTPAYIDHRVMVLDGVLTTTDPAVLIRARRSLGGLCNDPNQLYTLQVDDEVGSLFCLVQRSTEILSKSPDGMIANFSVSLTAPDPRLLDVTLQSAVTQMAQPGSGGVAWNGPAPGTTGTQWNGPTGTTGIAWGQPGPSGIVTVDNTAGTAPADVLLTIQGPVTNPTIITTAGVIVYGGPLSVSDVLVINTGTGSVLLNGANRRNLLTRAGFFQIPSGKTLGVSFSADLQNSSASLTAQWRNSYL